MQLAPPNQNGNTSQANVVLQPAGAAETDINGVVISGTQTSTLPNYASFQCKDAGNNFYQLINCAGVLSNGAFFFSDTIFGNSSFNYTYVTYQKQFTSGTVSQSFSLSHWPPFHPTTAAIAISFFLRALKGPLDEEDNWVLFNGVPIPQNKSLTYKIFSYKGGPTDTFQLTSEAGLTTTVTLYNFAFDASNNLINVTNILGYSGFSNLTYIAALISASRTFPFFSYVLLSVSPFV